MAVLSVDQAEPGMVLAAAVTDRQGRLLIPQGKELSERHVEALKMWGVTHVEVDGGEPADQYGAVDPDCLREAQQRLESHFVRAGMPHPFLDLLFEVCVNREARKLQKNREADHAA